MNIQDEKFSSYYLNLQGLQFKDLGDIENLIDQYPYCQSLYLLAARSAINTDAYQQKLAEAAVNSPSRNVLFDVIYAPEKFLQKEEQPQFSESEKENTSLFIGASEENQHEDEIFEEITPLEMPQDFQHANDNSAVENLSLDGEKYAETVLVQNPENEQAQNAQVGEPLTAEEETESKEDLKEAEILVDTAENEEQEAEEIENSPLAEEAALPQQGLMKVEQQRLSKYDDERLPYTFLWWLAKTRKTHVENNRPYAPYHNVQKAAEENGKDPLEHQIVENIFHINSVNLSETENTQTVAFDFMKKEHQIIEKFIKEEPHIKPPSADKIDNENKARKSSEDGNDLVSETLAKIYLEQMLFHKALDVYKKLSLKYPEKSAYFASQIKYLELKVN